MRRRPPRPPLFPYTTLFRSTLRTRRDDGRLPVAMVFQDARLLPWRKVVSNVGFGLEHGGFNADERREKAEAALALVDRKSTRLNSSHVEISYAVFCLKKKID